MNTDRVAVNKKRKAESDEVNWKDLLTKENLDSKGNDTEHLNAFIASCEKFLTSGSQKLERDVVVALKARAEDRKETSESLLNKKRKAESDIGKWKDLLTKENLDSKGNDTEQLNEFIASCEEFLTSGSQQLERDVVVALKARAEDRKEQFESQGKSAYLDDERIADIEHSITSSTMHYSYDVECFARRVDNLFLWHTDEAERNAMMAPYFPVIQSSGMGKTKLLYEYKKSLKGRIDISCLFLLCVKSQNEWNARITDRIDKAGTIFDSSFVIPNHLTTDNIRDSINEELNKLMEDHEAAKPERVVLIFDEAQFLLTNNAFAFRCIRWWLRKCDRITKRSPVAVFAGTSSQLANFYKEDGPSTNSRNKERYYLKGSKLYQPFFEFFTSGILASNCAQDGEESAGSNSDLACALKHGRPLFGVLSWDEIKTKMYTVCKRMLMVPNATSEWTAESFLSILGTRVQMGQTHFKVASNIVSRGYAVLTNFNVSQPDVAHIAFQQDPLCARIAMVLMQRGSSIVMEGYKNKICGLSPADWTSKADELFSGGLCFPAKGDIGEIAGALYLLFCGDDLRRHIDKHMYTFRVPLVDWIERLSKPHLKLSPKKKIKDACVEISFIQFCRNHLRHPTMFIACSQILEAWFNAGLAFYAHSQCFGYDLVAPIRISGEENLFVPLLIQVKNYAAFQRSDITSCYSKLDDCFETANVMTGVSMILLVGLDQAEKKKVTENTTNIKNNIKAVKSWCANLRRGRSEKNGKNILQLCIQVPFEDPFGVHQFARNASSNGGHRSEVYESHPILRQVTNQEGLKPGVDSMKCLRVKEEREFLAFFNELVKKMPSPKIPNPCD